MMFLVAAIPLIGMVGVGTEAGVWYVTKRHTQNAADAAAYAGALTLACQIAAASGASCADASAYNVRGAQAATDNGFTNGTKDATVTVQRGTYNSGTKVFSPSASGSYVRATVSQQQQPVLTSLLGVSTFNIGALATAQVVQSNPICALGLNGLTLNGNITLTNTSAGGCALLSDTTTKLGNNVTFSGKWAVDAVTGCESPCATPTVPYNWYMPPATNPLTKLDGEYTFTPSGANIKKPCNANGKVQNGDPTCPLAPLPTGQAYSGLSVSGSTVTLSAGVYFFYNANVSISGGTVTGTGVSIVLMGNSSLSITGGLVSLSANMASAPSDASGKSYPDLQGVLIDDQASGSPSNTVTITGGSTLPPPLKLGGTIYVPNNQVKYGGSDASAQTTCVNIIANTITLTGSAYMNTSGCTAGTVAQTQLIAMVQ